MNTKLRAKLANLLTNLRGNPDTLTREQLIFKLRMTQEILARLLDESE